MIHYQIDGAIECKAAKIACACVIPIPGRSTYTSISFWIGFTSMWRSYLSFGLSYCISFSLDLLPWCGPSFLSIRFPSKHINISTGVVLRMLKYNPPSLMYMLLPVDIVFSTCQDDQERLISKGKIAV
jgi:hypothetical protein